MTCDKAQELFSELHEETLAEGLRLKLNRHLQDCASCESDFATFQRTYSLFTSFGPTTVPDDLGEIIARRLDKVDYDRKQAAPARSGGWFRIGAVAAAAAAVIAVAVFYKPQNTGGVSAGFGPSVSQNPADLRIEKIEGAIAIRFTAKDDTRVDVLEGGVDHSVLPPVDAKQVRVDQVGAGANYNVPIEVQGPLPRPLWLKVSSSSDTYAVFFPQPAALTARSFEGNTVHALQAIANGYGVIVDARLASAGKKRQHTLEGDDPILTARTALKGTPYTDVKLKDGVLHIR